MKKIKAKANIQRNPTRHSRVRGNPEEHHTIENFRLDPRLRGDDTILKQKRNLNIELLFGLFLTFLGFLYFFYIILIHSQFLFKKYNPIQAEITYSQSQWQQSQNISPDKVLDEWAIKNGYTGWKNFEDETGNQSESPTSAKATVGKQKSKILKDIQNKGVSDSFLYSYVGYKYAHGANPSLLNPEHPPLAKYLIGCSIRFFGNEHMMGIGVAFLSLLLIGIISYQLSRSIMTASISLFAASLFPLFTDQIIHGPQLELYQLFFFLLVLHFLLMWIKKKKMIFCICAGVFFGMLLSTKTVVPFFLLFGAWLTFSFWKQWKTLIIIIGIGTLIFIATYYQFFLLGGALRSFLGLQKYIVTYYGNAHIPLLEFAGNYLRLIYTGSWKFWDSSRTISHYSEWNLLWPLIFSWGMWQLRSRWNKNNGYRMLIIFIILYNLFVFITPIFPRYLLLLFVPLVILL